MAGLLDFLGSDDARLGMGLLAAGGPSTVPMNVGQRVQMAMQGMDADKQNKLRQALLQSQIDENASQGQARIAQATAAQRKQAAMDSWMARLQGGGAGGAGGSAGGIQNMSADDIAAARLAGLPDLTPLWQATRPEMVEVAPGMWADKKTIQPGVNQQALSARRSDRVEQSDIGMRGEFVDVKGPDDRIYKVPKSSLVGSPAPAPLPMLPRQPGAVGGGGGPVNGQTIPRPMAERPGDRPSTDERAMIYAQEHREALQRLAQAQAAGDTAGIGRAMADVAGIEKEVQSQRIQLPAADGPVAPQMSPVPSGMPTGAIPSGMSRAETDAADVAKSGALKRQEAQITADAKRAQLAPKEAASRADSIMKADRIMSTIDDALKDVGIGTTGVGGSVLRNIPGTSARNLSGTLDTVKANLGFAELQAMRDASPTGGALGAIAVQELVALQSTVASLDQGQSPDQLKKNLGKIKQHYDKWKQTVEKAQTQGDGAAPAETPSAAPKGRIVDTLPTPNASNKGQRIRDTTTGKILVSNGLQWKEQ